jgi:hypothetical protein
LQQAHSNMVDAASTAVLLQEEAQEQAQAQQAQQAQDVAVPYSWSDMKAALLSVLPSYEGPPVKPETTEEPIIERDLEQYEEFQLKQVADAAQTLRAAEEVKASSAAIEDAAQQPEGLNTLLLAPPLKEQPQEQQPQEQVSQPQQPQEQVSRRENIFNILGQRQFENAQELKAWFQSLYAPTPEPKTEYVADALRFLKSKDASPADVRNYWAWVFESIARKRFLANQEMRAWLLSLAKSEPAAVKQAAREQAELASAAEASALAEFRDAASSVGRSDVDVADLEVLRDVIRAPLRMFRAWRGLRARVDTAAASIAARQRVVRAAEAVEDLAPSSQEVKLAEVVPRLLPPRPVTQIVNKCANTLLRMLNLESAARIVVPDNLPETPVSVPLLKASAATNITLLPDQTTVYGVVMFNEALKFANVTFLAGGGVRVLPDAAMDVVVLDAVDAVDAVDAAADAQAKAQFLQAQQPLSFVNFTTELYEPRYPTCSAGAGVLTVDNPEALAKSSADFFQAEAPEAKPLKLLCAAYSWGWAAAAGVQVSRAEKDYLWGVYNYVRFDKPASVFDGLGGAVSTVLQASSFIPVVGYLSLGVANVAAALYTPPSVAEELQQGLQQRVQQLRRIDAVLEKTAATAVGSTAFSPVMLRELECARNFLSERRADEMSAIVGISEQYAQAVSPSLTLPDVPMTLSSTLFAQLSAQDRAYLLAESSSLQGGAAGSSLHVNPFTALKLKALFKALPSAYTK